MGNKVHLSQIDELNLLTAIDSDALGAGGILVTPLFYVSGYTSISGFVFSDVSSATNGLIIEQGLTAVDFSPGAASTSKITRSRMTIVAGDIDNNAISVQVVAPFARIVYINGGAAQTVFRASFEARILRGL